MNPVMIMLLRAKDTSISKQARAILHRAVTKLIQSNLQTALDDIRLMRQEGL